MSTVGHILYCTDLPRGAAWPPKQVALAELVVVDGLKMNVASKVFQTVLGSARDATVYRQGKFFAGKGQERGCAPVVVHSNVAGTERARGRVPPLVLLPDPGNLSFFCLCFIFCFSFLCVSFFVFPTCTFASLSWLQRYGYDLS